MKLFGRDDRNVERANSPEGNGNQKKVRRKKSRHSFDTDEALTAAIKNIKVPFGTHARRQTAFF